MRRIKENPMAVWPGTNPACSANRHTLSCRNENDDVEPSSLAAMTLLPVLPQGRIALIRLYWDRTEPETLRYRH